MFTFVFFFFILYPIYSHTIFLALNKIHLCSYLIFFLNMIHKTCSYLAPIIHKTSRVHYFSGFIFHVITFYPCNHMDFIYIRILRFSLSCWRCEKRSAYVHSPSPPTLSILEVWFRLLFIRVCHYDKCNQSWGFTRVCERRNRRSAAASLAQMGHGHFLFLSPYRRFRTTAPTTSVMQHTVSPH